MQNLAQNFKKYRWVLILVFLLIPQIIVFAQVGTGGGSGSGDPGTGSGSTSGQDLGKLENPINVDTLPELAVAILKIINLIGVPVVTLFLLWAGFLFVKAQGDSKALTTAKETLLWTVVGAAILLGSYVLAEAISGSIQELQK